MKSSCVAENTTNYPNPPASIMQILNFRSQKGKHFIVEKH